MCLIIFNFPIITLFTNHKIDLTMNNLNNENGTLSLTTKLDTRIKCTCLLTQAFNNMQHETFGKV
jgi:hypothetical protein